jgi:hypothetical protein
VRQGDSDDCNIHFNDDLSKSEEYLPKKEFGTDLGKNTYGDEHKQGHPKPVPNPFQIQHLELDIWAFGPKLEYGSHPLQWIFRPNLTVYDGNVADMSPPCRRDT